MVGRQDRGSAVERRDQSPSLPMACPRKGPALWICRDASPQTRLSHREAYELSKTPEKTLIKIPVWETHPGRDCSVLLCYTRASVTSDNFLQLSVSPLGTVMPTSNGSLQTLSGPAKTYFRRPLCWGPSPKLRTHPLLPGVTVSVPSALFPFVSSVRSFQAL